MTRRRPAHRLTSALIGAVVAAVGVLTIALLSGRQLDTELIAIVTLAAVGGWLLITALLAGRRPRSGRWTGQDEPASYAGKVSPTASGAMPGHETATPDSGQSPLTDAARTAASAAASKARRGDTETPTETSD